jgi:hypothetical protein
MGQRFQITESERKRIKSLYEQESPTKELSIGELVFTDIIEYRISVDCKGDDGAFVTIKLDIDGNFIGADIEENYSETMSDDEAVAFVIQKGREGYFDKLPTYMSWDMEKDEPFDFN